MIDDQTVLRRREGTWAVEADGELVMLDPKSGTYYALDPVGRRVWELLEQPRTTGLLLAALTEQYQADADLVRADTLAFLAALHEQGLLQAGGSPSEPL